MTVVRFGSRRVNAELQLSFQNIPDDDATLILQNYEQVNSVWDYVTFSATDGASRSVNHRCSSTCAKSAALGCYGVTPTHQQ